MLVDYEVRLGLTTEGLAQHPDQITPDTKAYVGDLVQRDSQGNIIPIFKKLAQGVKDIYTLYPKRQIPFWNLEVGGKSPSELERALDSAAIEVELGAKSMMRSHQFTTLDRSETRRLVMLSIRDMGFPTAATNSPVFERADALGLGKCDAETGVYQRLADLDQVLYTTYYIGMDPIPDSDGKPGIFWLESDGFGPRLNEGLANPDRLWHPESRLVFLFGK